MYYRGRQFDPDTLRALGWPGEIFPIGGLEGPAGLQLTLFSGLPHPSTNG